MKPVRIHNPKPQTTLPAHEQAARRLRANTERPSCSPTPRRAASRPARSPSLPADFRTNPQLFGQ